MSPVPVTVLDLQMPLVMSTQDSVNANQVTFFPIKVITEIYSCLINFVNRFWREKV